MTRTTVIRGVIFLLGLAIGVGLFAYFVAREGWGEIVREIVTFGLWPFAGFVGLSLINFFLYSWRWQIILNRQLPKGQRVNVWSMYWHRMSGFATGYLTPLAQVGGEPARVALVMTDGVALQPAVSSVTLDIAFELCAYVVFIFAGVVLAFTAGTGDVGVLWWMAGGLAALFMALTGFFLAIASGKRVFHRFFHSTGLFKLKAMKGLERWFEETEDLMGSFFQGNTKLIVGISVLSIVMIAFRVVEALYIAYFFGVPMTLGQAFLTSTLPGIALLLPIPGGLGVFEGGFAALFTALGIGLDPVAFALIIRLRDVLFIGLGVTHMVRRGGTFLVSRMETAAKALK